MKGPVLFANGRYTKEVGILLKSIYKGEGLEYSRATKSRQARIQDFEMGGEFL